MGLVIFKELDDYCLKNAASGGDSLLEVKTHRPKFCVGLNPTVHFLYSGFRPRGHYLEAVGLNPED